MPEPKQPQNFGEMYRALDASFSEDAETAFSMPQSELDKFLDEERIDPAPTVAKVKRLIAQLKSGVNKCNVAASVNVAPKRVLYGHKRRFWTHPSILKLGTDDPIDYILKKASEVVLEALQNGWIGPPFDPAKLAELSDVRIVPKADIADARIIPLEERKFQIEFNPAKNRARIHFSLAHELAHKLFPDCREAIRNRVSRESMADDDWQLEMLCNLAAGEFLMPIGHFPQFKSMELSIRKMLELRKQYEVSTEAVLHRFARVTELPCAVFAASERKGSGYKLEYAVPSRSWPILIPNGLELPKKSRLGECTAIGFTAVGQEEWIKELGNVEVQCVRISPYPGESVPRFVGFIRPNISPSLQMAKIIVLKGDATEPRGDGLKIVGLIVNDRTPNLGAGFGRNVQQKWPETKNAFRSWAEKHPRSFSLGNIFCAETHEKDILVFHMICQRGYGPSPTPRLRYSHLKTCLEKLGQFAIQHKATVHLPKLGTGHAGGSWVLIEQMIDEVLCSQGLNVTVYELPNQSSSNPSARSLFD